MIRELTCINCPLGCDLTVKLDENNEVVDVSGNNCKMGEIYAKKEVKDPRRMVCSTVRLIGGKYNTVPVKTKSDIPKGKIFEVMKEINNAEAKAPVHIGDILIEDLAGTGVSLVSTAERE
ncbi:MAG: DUF1667 domain-containing protein [Tissierellia bacterium]|nr:DUF1667 domain-containing protein [Tissierellia bacterium]